MIEVKTIPPESQETPRSTDVQTRELELGNSTLRVRCAADVDDGYMERLKRFCCPKSDGVFIQTEFMNN